MIFSSSPSAWFESFQQGSTLWPVKQKKAVDICSDSGLSLQIGAFCSANNSPLDFSRPCAEGENTVTEKVFRYVFPKRKRKIGKAGSLE